MTARAMLLVLAIGVGRVAAEAPAPSELFAAMDRKLAAAKSMRYQCTIVSLSNTPARRTADVVLRRGTGGEIGGHVRVSALNDERTSHTHDLFFDGRQFTVVDHTQRTYVVAAEASALGEHAEWLHMVYNLFFEAAERELADDPVVKLLQHAGEVKVADEPCYRLVCKTGEDSEIELELFVSSQDQLLRRILVKGQTDNLYTNVVLDPPSEGDPFTLPSFEGYQRVDPTAETAMLKAGTPAPAFELAALEGQDKLKLADLAGKVVVLDFWASWCHPCIVALPELEKVRAAFAADDRVRVIGINMDDDESGLDAARKLVAHHKLRYTQLMGNDTVAQAYRIEGFPTLIVIGRDGKVALVHVGSSDTLAADLKQAIEQLLAR